MKSPSRHLHQSLRLKLAAAALVAAALGLAGCHVKSGKPGAGPEVLRPDEIVDFPTLYKTNCSACHGADGLGGAAMSLANPLYLAVAGPDVIHNTVSHGVPGKLMPPFARSSGGTLTDNQIDVLVKGMMQRWAAPVELANQNPPPYKTSLIGHSDQGHSEFQRFCASCHGPSAEGFSKPLPGNGAAGKIGSIVDPTYLDLVSNQSVRSVIIAGRRDQGMPDWRSDGHQPMTDQQITDIVAWIVSKRIENPGQPYAADQ